MKFLCVECDRQMTFEERELPGDGTLAATFRCPTCNRTVAMLTNPAETQLVSSLGVKIGGESVPGRDPFELVGAFLGGGEGTPAEGAPRWDAEAARRLERVPGFVRGMVKRLYTDYARERGIGTITPEVMDRARSELGLEGM